MILIFSDAEDDDDASKRTTCSESKPGYSRMWKSSSSVISMTFAHILSYSFYVHYLVFNCWYRVLNVLWFLHDVGLILCCLLLWFHNLRSINCLIGFICSLFLNDQYIWFVACTFLIVFNYVVLFVIGIAVVYFFKFVCGYKIWLASCTFRTHKP